jgi:hypothetical protein
MDGGALHLRIMGHATPEFRGGGVYVVNAVFTLLICMDRELKDFAVNNVNGTINRREREELADLDGGTEE